jgi:hypothetical protein
MSSDKRTDNGHYLHPQQLRVGVFVELDLPWFANILSRYAMTTGTGFAFAIRERNAVKEECLLPCAGTRTGSER